MARFDIKSLTKVQTAGLAVMSVVFHKPPETLPANTVFLAGSSESTISALTRPAVIPPLARVLPLLTPTTSALGPRSSQFKALSRSWRDISLACSVASLAVSNFCQGTRPEDSSRVISISCRMASSGPSYSPSSSSLLGEES